MDGQLVLPGQQGNSVARDIPPTGSEANTPPPPLKQVVFRKNIRNKTHKTQIKLEM